MTRCRSTLLSVVSRSWACASVSPAGSSPSASRHSRASASRGGPSRSPVLPPLVVQTAERLRERHQLLPVLDAVDVPAVPPHARDLALLPVGRHVQGVSSAAAGLLQGGASRLPAVAL